MTDVQPSLMRALFALEEARDDCRQIEGMEGIIAYEKCDGLIRELNLVISDMELLELGSQYRTDYPHDI